MKLLLIALFALPLAHAEDAPPPSSPSVAEKREENQEKRIEDGVKNGSLTKREARRLERQQKHIGAADDKAEADGVVTGKEAKHLNHMQNRASRDIVRKKHNVRHR